MTRRLLLDTHVLLWWLGDDPSLKAPVRAQLAAPENLVFVSAASIWEMRIKEALGKLDLPADFGLTLVAHDDSLREYGVPLLLT